MNIADIRREYGALSLDDDQASTCPMALFEAWFLDAVKVEKIDPNAMVLSTVDEWGHPDSRIVLLKDLQKDAFIFYTNYLSVKAQQLENNPYAALNFYWPTLSRQVRIRGTIQRTSAVESDEYFYSRPINSQLSAIASPQSQKIENREALIHALDALKEQPITRPTHWGGYRVTPFEIEFFQGRDNRLHDRIQYCLMNNAWTHHRLAP